MEIKRAAELLRGLADGRDPQAIELAQKIIADQEAEIEEMQGLLASA